MYQISDPAMLRALSRIEPCDPASQHRRQLMLMRQEVRRQAWRAFGSRLLAGMKIRPLARPKVRPCADAA